MRPMHLIEALKAVLPTGQNVWIHGPPGVGKTDVAVRACEEADLYLWRHPPAITLESVDLRGLPNIRNDQTVWAKADIWPTDDDAARISKRICIFLDELSQGQNAVQAGYMQAVHSRRIGDMTIPASCVFLACGNRQEDRAGASRVITPLLNRFLHLDFETSLDDWQMWAIGAEISPEVRGFLKYRPNLLHFFDPKLNERAFCTPRSWHFVSNILPNTPASLMHQIVGGLVGEGPAAEFTAFLQVYRDLPDLDGVLANPLKATIPASNPAVMYALSTALAEKSRSMDKLDDLAAYAGRFPAEFSALCLRDTWTANCVRQPGGGLKGDRKLYQPKSMAWVEKHKDVLADCGLLKK